MDSEALIVLPMLFIGLPWLILHYVTKWKSSPNRAQDDEEMVEDLYQLARRLEKRMETVERLVESDRLEMEMPRSSAQHEIDRKIDRDELAELDQMLAKKRGAKL